MSDHPSWVIHQKQVTKVQVIFLTKIFSLLSQARVDMSQNYLISTDPRIPPQASIAGGFSEITEQFISSDWADYGHKIAG